MSQEAIQRIDELDLEPITFKLVHPEPDVVGMSIEEADRAVELYRQFLKIIAMYPNKSIVPTKLVDEVWHTHILDTVKYEEDCQNLFGFFLHHFPYFGLRGPEDAEKWHAASAETRELFLHHFGTELLAADAVPAECEPSCSGGESGGCDYNFTVPRSHQRERPRLVRD